MASSSTLLSSANANVCVSKEILRCKVGINVLRLFDIAVSNAVNADNLNSAYSQFNASWNSLSENWFEGRSIIKSKGNDKLIHLFGQILSNGRLTFDQKKENFIFSINPLIVELQCEKKLYKEHKEIHIEHKIKSSPPISFLNEGLAILESTKPLIKQIHNTKIAQTIDFKLFDSIQDKLETTWNNLLTFLVFNNELSRHDELLSTFKKKFEKSTIDINNKFRARTNDCGDSHEDKCTALQSLLEERHLIVFSLYQEMLKISNEIE